ncbi:YgiT-type zinc finger protein [Candidatus Poribacteria bacterium]|nr:YgiT-type zinc finger protein [Candidatus Poribacteria bacterium]
MTNEYSDCYYCGGVVKEKRMPRELRWQGQLFICEDVPMGVCTQCGEKVLKPEVAKAIDLVLHEKKKPTRTIEVPVYHYESDAPFAAPV